MRKKRNAVRRYYIVLAIILFLLLQTVSAKTRWSSLHIVPDADLFNSGEFTIGFDGYLAKDTSEKIVFKPTIPLKIGITEWVNLDLAYAGGMSLGIKCRILGETAKAMPSMAVGVHNLFNHKEVNWFSIDSAQAEDMTSEIFLAFSKGAEAIKTRFHLGLQTIPTSKKDKINPYVAVEKYFGVGLYISLEFYRRQKEFHLSLFTNWRLLRRHLEISFGAVDLRSMFFDEKNKFSVSLTPFDGSRFVKPGIWMGIKFHGSFGLGNNKGFMSVEDRMRVQDETIESLVQKMDSLDARIKESSLVLDEVRDKMGIVIDSVVNDPNRLENIIFDKLVALKSLYKEEPFDPQRVKLLKREIASFREKATPSLEKLLIDPQVDRHIRMYSAAMLGAIGNTASSDVLLDVLAKTQDPDIKIEILIALGKLKETRAMYLLEQLANSPNDAVAITAQEVLLRLSEETGADVSKGLKLRRIAIDEEKKLTKPAAGRTKDIYISEPQKTKAAPKDTLPAADSVKAPASKTGFEEEDIQTGEKDTVTIEEEEVLEEEKKSGQDTTSKETVTEAEKEKSAAEVTSKGEKKKEDTKKESAKEEKKGKRKKGDKKERRKKDKRKKEKREKEGKEDKKKARREKSEEEKEKENKNW